MKKRMDEQDRRSIMQDRRRMLDAVHQGDSNLIEFVEKVASGVSDLVDEHRALSANLNFLMRQLELYPEERDYEQIQSPFYEEGRNNPVL